MSERPTPFAPGEYFHCFTRGVDKRKIFMEESDCERFQMLLYTCNSTTPIHISNLKHPPRKGPALPHVLKSKRGKQLVEIGVYCLMPNHLHILMSETDYGGISSFMQKIGTGYTMYFNKKYNRTGALFSGKFRAVHVRSDSHSRRVIHYIHANPAELYEPAWKKGVIHSEANLKRQLLTYPFSSLIDYEGTQRPETAILAKDTGLALVDSVPNFKALLKDARAFIKSEKDVARHLES